jgi:hypothetical protein
MYPSNLDVPGPAYDMDAALMLLEQHERGIHALCPREAYVSPVTVMLWEHSSTWGAGRGSLMR